MSLTGWIKRRSFRPPANLLGADLFWWQANDDLQTLITIYTPTIPTDHPQTLRFTFVLFDAHGVPRTSWQRDLRDDETIVIDSAALGRVLPDREVPAEGTLAAFLSSKQPVPKSLARNYNRLYSLIDWYSESGELVSLHNDQSVVAGNRPIEFTEIAFLENDTDRNFLVVLNGNEPQAAESIRLTVTNHRDETRTGLYRPAMKPYPVLKLYLDELFPDLRAFCEDRHACVHGEFQCRGLFVRPYVMTRGRHLSGYHGGDRYEMGTLPREKYEQLGQGEVNPMAVVNRDGLHTFVNLFNTHGNIEEDFWVDARLYDEQGRLIADKPRWLLARRHQLVRGDTATLLGDTPFVGHIALSFTPDDDKPEYPGRLQALMEYKTDQNTSRVMAWSDEWNSEQRLESAAAVLKAYYRVWCRPPIVSYLSITNSGLSPDYDRTVPYTIRLKNTEGAELVYEGELAPQATDFGPLDKWFPDAGEFAGTSSAAMVVVESIYDLAIVQFSRHERSKVCSAEHFMSLCTIHEGRALYPCGS